MTSVLIVDDKEENLYYLQALFTGYGYAVTTARHGAEALVKARQSPPDIVVSDLLMPVMDGYTLLRHWKSEPRLSQIPFIVYTATYTEAEDEQLALSLGADAFILKPTEPDVFLARVREVQAKAATAAPANPKPSPDDASDLMKVYSETLIRKLEQKSLQLEETNRALQESASRIERLNRVYAVLSQINALIVRASDRVEVFEEACRIAVAAGGFRMSMIGILDPATKMIVPAASAGKDANLLAAVSTVLSSSEEASGTLVARVVREKLAHVVNNLQSDPRVLLSRKYAEHGVRSLVVLPLIVAGETVGVLALFASEIDYFHEEEMKLLTELAGDVAFAIDHIDKRERLEYLAYYDALTGLANRTLFLERVAQYLRIGGGDDQQLALFLFDIERFKNINDSLGRTSGDALLKQVADWMAHIAGDPNLLARVGADHFALVLPVVKPEGNISRLLERAMDKFLEHPFQLDGNLFRIAVKVGIAVFPLDGDNADTLFKHAEAALKKAKATGNRYLFFNKTMSERVASNLSLENHLHHALGNDEFVLYYQPQVNLATGKITGAEALIRWNDPRTGLVPPNNFIPVLEETGLIHDVGRWALHKAIADYLRWRDAGLPAVRIAVNVSPLQLRNRGFVAEVQQLCAIDPRAAAGLELEITESMVMENIEHGIATLQLIRALGVSIAIDDFGTGFSSLSYLSKLPVDILKIDRSFVTDMTAGPDGLSLVTNIITLAHSLKLNVVAEGVETEEQSRLLRLLKCDEMQGFLFSKPIPCELFESRFLAQPAGA
jgi:diguanylate cyclase (GGDEF)-like protein